MRVNKSKVKYFVLGAVFLLAAVVGAASVLKTGNEVLGQQLALLFNKKTGESMKQVAGEYSVHVAQTKSHPYVIADQVDFDLIKQKIQNNEQPWRKQYDLLMSQASGLGSSPGSGYWVSTDCNDFNSRKNKGDRGGRELATLNLACILSDDAAVCTKAKSQVLGWATPANLAVVLCGNDQNAIHSVNSLILSEALGYDWLYANLSLSEQVQVVDWLEQAGNHLRTVHGLSNRCHNKEAWDDVALTLTGLAINDPDMVNYALGIGSYVGTHQSIKDLIGCSIRSNGNVCDSYYGCNGVYGGSLNDYLAHDMLLWEAMVLSSAAGAENGYENYFQTQPKLSASFDFYAPLFQGNDMNRLDYTGVDFSQPASITEFNWLWYSGIYEIGYKFLPSNANIKNTLLNQNFNYYGSPSCSDCPAAPEYNQGIPRFCVQSNCSRWLKYPNLIFGQVISSSPPPNCATCGAWQNQSCGAGGCNSTQMFQTRTGCPTGCAVSQCVANASCGGSSCTVGANCTTAQNCPGTYNSSCACVDVAGDNCPSGGNTCNNNGTCETGETTANCPADCTGGGQTEIMKIATGAKNPAVAVDSLGNLHFAYDCQTYIHSKGIGAHNACYRKVYSENGEIKMSMATILTEGDIVLSADPRIVIDNNDNAHIMAGGRYAVVTTSGQTFAQDFADIDNARLAIDKNSNNAFLLYRAGRYGGIMLKKLSFDGNNINEIWTKTINPACASPQMPGNVVLENNNIYVSWEEHTDEGGCTGEHTQVQSYDQVSGAVISSRTEIFKTTSNFTDMFYNPDKQEFHFIATNAYGQGFSYRTMDKNHILSPRYILYDRPNMVVFNASERFGEGNTVGPYLSMDKGGDLYLSFSGAGTQLMPNSSVYYFTAYYTILDRAQLHDGANNAPALTRFTPDHWSDQGTVGSNPIIGPAWNQGVFFAYEDNYENPLFDIYLKAAGGAVIGIPEMKADFNCDNKVNILDFGIMMSCWAGAFNYPNCASGANIPNGCDKKPDINMVGATKGDGTVNVLDLAAMLSCWGGNNSPQCMATKSGPTAPNPPATAQGADGTGSCIAPNSAQLANRMSTQALLPEPFLDNFGPAPKDFDDGYCSNSFGQSVLRLSKQELTGQHTYVPNSERNIFSSDNKYFFVGRDGWLQVYDAGVNDAGALLYDFQKDNITTGNTRIPKTQSNQFLRKNGNALQWCNYAALLAGGSTGALNCTNVVNVGTSDWAGGDGNDITDNDQYILMNQGNTLAVYDLTNKNRKWSVGQPCGTLDYATLSSLGNYAIAYCDNQESDGRKHVYIYDINNGVSWQDFLPWKTHAEVGIDPQGDEVLFTIVNNSAGANSKLQAYTGDRQRAFEDDDLIMIKLKNKQARILADLDPAGSYLNATMSVPFGNRNFIVLSLQKVSSETNTATEMKNNWLPYEGEIIKAPLNGSGQIERLAHTYSSTLGGAVTLRAQADAAVSGDGKTIVFRAAINADKDDIFKIYVP